GLPGGSPGLPWRLAPHRPLPLGLRVRRALRDVPLGSPERPVRGETGPRARCRAAPGERSPDHRRIRRQLGRSEDGEPLLRRARSDRRAGVGARPVDAGVARRDGLAHLSGFGSGVPRHQRPGADPRGHALLGDDLPRPGPRRPVVRARNGAALPDRLEHPGPQLDRVGLHRERRLDGDGALMRRALLPLALALLGLTGSGVATLSLHRAASATLQRATEERLRGAGATAARTLEQPGFEPDAGWLGAVVESNGLEGALLVDPQLRVVMDPSGAADRPLDLLRVDVARVRRALAGEPSLSLGWTLGDARVASAYFPVRRGGAVERV